MDRIAGTRLLFAAVLLGCGPQVEVEPAGSPGSSEASGSSSEASSSSSDDGDVPAPTTEVDEDASTTSDGDDDDGDGTSTGGAADATSGSSCAQVVCDGALHACGDGIDNDGDGRVDLDDPHCLSPCHDDEAAFDDAHPGDALDCWRDCYFDSNTGAGDDGCRYNLLCDPLSPGDAIGCGFQVSPGCADDAVPGDHPEECRSFCEPYVPPGCDCFGCCEVPTEAGTEHVLLLGATDDCSPDNLEDCPRCTSSMDVCGNPCDECDICFGRPELPPSCDTNTCDEGPTCASACDCPDGGYCLMGCCYPPPP